MGGEHTGLARIRQARVRPAPDLSLAGMMAAQAREIRRRQRATEGVGEAWDAAVPADLRERSFVEGVSRGVLTVRAANAPTRYELERLLRAGLEREVIRRCSAPVRRVKLVV
jgi:hypothetical protein